MLQKSARCIARFAGGAPPFPTAFSSLHLTNSQDPSGKVGFGCGIIVSNDCVHSRTLNKSLRAGRAHR